MNVLLTHEISTLKQLRLIIYFLEKLSVLKLHFTEVNIYSYRYIEEINLSLTIVQLCTR